MHMIILLLLEFLLFFFIRLLPVWRFRHQGCDAYYFLLTAEIFRKKKKIPIVLPPYYLADIEEQWYPPGFSVFLGLLPEWIVQKYHWLINHILDFLNLLLLDCFIWAFHMGWRALLVANLVYIFTPTLTLEYRGLTSRSLGNLLFTLFMMAMWGTLMDVRWLPAALFVWLLILFTHKMTMQLGVVMGIVLSVVFKTWLPVIVVIGGIPLAIVLSKGYYWKILKGHWDIVSFWHKNLPCLGAHQVYDSPVYNPDRYAMKKKRSLTEDCLKLGKYYLLHNPFLILILFWFVFSAFGGIKFAELKDIGLKGETGIFLLAWSFVVFGWAAVTTLIPGFKALGEGYKYLKYSALPVSILVAACGLTCLVIGMVVATCLLFRSTRHLFKEAVLDKIDDDLNKMILWIERNPQVDRIGCINTHFADLVVYHCRRRVLWGTHHYWFNEKVVDFFPVLRKNIKKLNAQYDLRFWIINKSYVDPAALKFIKNSCVYETARYALYGI